MKSHHFRNFAFIFILIYLIGCNDNAVENVEKENVNIDIETTNSNNSIDTTTNMLSKIGVDPKALEVGWQVLYDYEFDHYVAKSEFGIWPTEYRQHAGSSGNPDRIVKLNELHSKWGFNYIAAHIGELPNITAIETAGFPKETNYMAIVEVNQAGRNAVANLYNGLSSSDYFGPIIQMNLYQYKTFHNIRSAILKIT